MTYILYYLANNYEGPHITYSVHTELYLISSNNKQIQRYVFSKYNLFIFVHTQIGRRIKALPNYQHFQLGEGSLSVRKNK